MAFNPKSFKVAMAQAAAVPSGWFYDAASDSYINGKGLKVTQLDIIDHGDLTRAIIAIFGTTALQTVQGATSGPNQMASAPGANGPAGPYVRHSSGKTPPKNPNIGDWWSDDVSGQTFVYETSGWQLKSAQVQTTPMNASISSAHDLKISNGQPYAFHNPPTNVISIETKLGRISVDTETGDITVPVGVGRDDAIREFWFGFQKHFQPSNNSKYETEIEGLKRDYVRLETYYKEKLVNIEKNAAKPIVEKVRKKYGNEKFIMVKPEDLIKFIEG